MTVEDWAMAVTVAAICWSSLQLVGIEHPGIYFLVTYAAAKIEQRTR